MLIYHTELKKYQLKNTESLLKLKGKSDINFYCYNRFLDTSTALPVSVSQRIVQNKQHIHFSRGKIHEITCPVERKIDPDFPVSKVSSYSSTVLAIKPGYISTILHITENMMFFPSQYIKVRLVL